MTPEVMLPSVGRLLALAIRGGRTPADDSELHSLYEQVGAATVREAARSNQLGALVGVGLDRAGVRIPAEWSDAIARNASRVSELMSALRAVVARLEDDHVTSAAIEAGGVLLDTALPIEGYCPGDIDLLVDGAGWEKALAAFRAEDFRVADRRERPTRRCELRRTLRDGREQWLEVGSAAFDRMWVPLAFEDPSPSWLPRRVRSRKDPELHVLEPSDALALVCIHTSMHSYVRAPGLRLHVDVDRLVRDCSIDWDKFVGEVERAGVRRRAFFSLALAAAILGTPIPDGVLARLAPPARVRDRALRLLSPEGIAADELPKLSRLRAVELDLLLDEGGCGTWASRLVLPPRRWMREHFDRGGAGHSIPRLHLRRLGGLLTRWRPR